MFLASADAQCWRLLPGVLGRLTRPPTSPDVIPPFLSSARAPMRALCSVYGVLLTLIVYPLSGRPFMFSATFVRTANVYFAKAQTEEFSPRSRGYFPPANEAALGSP